MWNISDSTVPNKSNNSDTDAVDAVVYNWEVLVLLPIMLFGMTGNILVCMAVSMEKRLQSVTNYFLLSLAITDLLVSVIVMPLSIVHQFFGKFPIKIKNLSAEHCHKCRSIMKHSKMSFS
jgi:hypothetical protein